MKNKQLDQFAKERILTINDKESKEAFLRYLTKHYGYIPDYWYKMVQRRELK